MRVSSGRRSPGLSCAGAPNRMSLIASHLQGCEAAVDRIVAPGHEGSGIRAEKEGQPGHFVRTSHPPDRLRTRQLLEHLALASGVVPGQESIDEWRVHPGRGDTVAADVLCHVVARQ